MAGSLDDNPPKLFGGDEYEYLVLGQDKARIFVSRDGVMTRKQIADQLRRLAAYVENLSPDEANRP